MANIIFQAVNRDYDKLDEIKRIYEEAFPSAERRFTIDDILALIEKNENLRLDSVIGDGEIVGFFAIMEAREYFFGFYLAIRSDLRGNGYGTKIMKALFEAHPDKTMLFTIENPVENAPNYAQRVNREKLYTRLGCIRTGYDININGENYIFMCNRMSDNVKGYIEDCLERAADINLLSI